MGNQNLDFFAVAGIDRAGELLFDNAVDGAGDHEFGVHRRFHVVQSDRDVGLTSAFGTDD